MFVKVAEFHNAFGLLVSPTLYFPPLPTRKLRVAILTEEWQEYHDAETDDDLIEVADALVDMAYIICGTLLTYGMAPEEPYTPIFCQTNGPPEFPSSDYRKVRMELLDRDFNAYLEAETDNLLTVIKSRLLHLLETVSATAFCYGIPLLAAFNEVHRSNMTKLDENGKPIYREDGKVIKGPFYSPPDIKSVLFSNT